MVPVLGNSLAARADLQAAEVAAVPEVQDVRSPVAPVVAADLVGGAVDPEADRAVRLVLAAVPAAVRAGPVVVAVVPAAVSDADNHLVAAVGVDVATPRSSDLRN